MEDVEPRLARHRTAALITDSSESTIRRMIREKELRAIKVGADLRIPVAEIDAWIARKLTESEREARESE